MKYSLIAMAALSACVAATGDKKPVGFGLYSKHHDDNWLIKMKFSGSMQMPLTFPVRVIRNV